MVVKKARSIRGVVVVIDYNTIDATRGNGIRDLALTLSSIVSTDLHVMEDHFHFVITKMPNLKKGDFSKIIYRMLKSEKDKLPGLKKKLETKEKQSKKSMSSEPVKKLEDDIKKVSDAVRILKMLYDAGDRTYIVNYQDRKGYDKINDEISKTVNNLSAIPKSAFDFGKYDPVRIQFDSFLDAVYQKAISVLVKVSSMQTRTQMCHKDLQTAIQAREVENKAKRIMEKVNLYNDVSLISDVFKELEKKLVALRNLAADLQANVAAAKDQVNQTKSLISQKDTDEQVTIYNQPFKTDSSTWTRHSYKFRYEGDTEIDEIIEKSENGKINSITLNKVSGKYISEYRGNLWESKCSASVQLTAKKRNKFKNEIQTHKDELFTASNDLKQLEETKAETDREIKTLSAAIDLYKGFQEKQKQDENLENEITEITKCFEEAMSNKSISEKAFNEANAQLVRLVDKTESKRSFFNLINEISLSLNPDSAFFSLFNERWSHYKRNPVPSFNLPSTESVSQSSSMELAPLPSGLICSSSRDVSKEKQEAKPHLALSPNQKEVEISSSDDKKEFEELKEKFDALLLQNESYQSEISAYESILEAKTRQIDDLRGELQSLTSRLAEVRFNDIPACANSFPPTFAQTESISETSTASLASTSVSIATSNKSSQATNQNKSDDDQVSDSIEKKKASQTKLLLSFMREHRKNTDDKVPVNKIPMQDKGKEEVGSDVCSKKQHPVSLLGEIQNFEKDRLTKVDINAAESFVEKNKSLNIGGFID